MRAKRVYENIEFKRGEDPKVTLGIGPWKDGYRVYSHGDWEDLNLPIYRYFDFNLYNWNKKPWDVDDIERETEVNAEIEDELSRLPVLSFKDYRSDGKMLGLLDDWPDDFPYRNMPFIANVESDEGRSFLVDPEGYSYARYVTEIV